MELEASKAGYEVYLSFRGIDIRQGFADILYEHMDRAGIRVFRDEDELAIGDKMDKILLAINNSHICVPIFSKTFAQSNWCLDEVRKMVELRRDVVPIFYDVTPDDVALKTPVYKGFMAEHESVYGKDQVNDWGAALGAIAKLKGRDLGNTSYTKFCKIFSQELLLRLKPRRRYELDHLVGINDQLESALKLLDIGAGGVRYLIIHGMGGIGKTTLAKIIFDKLSTSFDCCSFLENLQESLSRDSVDYLQKQLGDSLDPKSATAFTLSRNIKDRFYSKKVLIVLDDVVKCEQIEKLVRKSWFASGSRIIITARNINVLSVSEDLSEDSVKYLEMRMLEDDEALSLFNTYAFRNESPPAVFKDLSREAVSTAGGLPLTVKIIASLLRVRGKNPTIWIDVIRRLRKIPPKEVKDRLRISYDALEPDQQQIFLDIACFFNGTEKPNPCYMWEACDFYPIYGLEVLVSMSLVKITDKNVIWMHDQLRDLGRDMVREESVMYPLKRSRLWLREEAFKVLMAKEGKEAVEALSLHERLLSTLTEKHFISFQNIRFLEMAGANIEGDFDGLLVKLIWFSWHLCPSSFNICSFYLENLVILDLSYSLIDECWGGWRWIQMLHNLKVLDLRSCHNLINTPYLSKNGTLERLILSGCSKLETVDGSIGRLRCLVHLDLRDCHSLTGLPEELGSLEALEELYVSGDSGKFSLPAAIGDLRSLLSLILEDLEITDIPDTIGRLVKLKYLSILGCHGMDTLPESIGDMTSLVNLDLSWTKLSGLPDSIGRLVKLKELCLRGCSEIANLPETLGNLTSLVNLDLSHAEILLSLPDSIGGLQELLKINLSECFNLGKLPQSIRSMKKLEELDASFCYFLDEVPEEIAELSSLIKLRLAGSRIRRVPSKLSQLPLLEELDLEGCNQLEELSQVPSTLTLLCVKSSSLQKMPDLSKLSNLVSLSVPINNYPGSPELYERKKVEGIEHLTKLKKLGLRLPSISNLPFELSCLTQLEALFIFIQPPESSSEDPVPEHSGVDIQLPCLSSLKKLSDIRFSCLLLEDGLESLGIQDLEMLDNVWMGKCSRKLIEVCLVKTLRFLTIAGCKSLKTLPDLSHLRSLVHFKVQFCDELTDIPGLEGLESLSYIGIQSCGSLERLRGMAKLRKLSSITIVQCRRMRCIENFNMLFVEELIIDGCESFENLEELKERCRFGMFEGLRYENYG
ncbi:hypothetical protein SAY87_007120 [Trapa incisa]|uniref:TIR domain-containing protein n=1 Tax=Trapa incisa TaxID=236973 RepID=A0AAN7Q0B8_9MYRT|nr:hypothetical protein SAY87_007120 [Trapa incisa]